VIRRARVDLVARGDGEDEPINAAAEAAARAGPSDRQPFFSLGFNDSETELCGCVRLGGRY
jgi:hypothetical protein